MVEQGSTQSRERSFTYEEALVEVAYGGKKSLLGNSFNNVMVSMVVMAIMGYSPMVGGVSFLEKEPNYF